MTRLYLSVLAQVTRVALVVGIVEAALTALVLAGWYGDFVLAPYPFFHLEIYSGFVKVALLAREHLGLGATAHAFVEPSAASKLALLPYLALQHAAGAVVPAMLGAALLASSRVAKNRLVTDAAWRLLIATEASIQLGSYAWRVHLPAGADAQRIAANLARDFTSGGTAAAMAILIASALASRVALRTRWASSVAALALFAIAAGAWPLPTAPGVLAAPAPQKTPPAPAIAAGYNVVLISIDSLRADHVSAYGYPRATTPTLDSWARRGVLFRHASSTTSWTLPAHVSMLTGRSLLSHGVTGDDRALRGDVPTIAATLREAGYRTGAVVSGPYLHSRYGFAHGFDDYDDRSVTYESFTDHARKITSPLVHAAASRWLDANAGDRFFLFLHYWDVHYDYNPPPPYDTLFDPEYRGSASARNFYFDPAIHAGMDPADLRHIVSLYDGEIRYVDDYLAKLEAKLAELGVLDRTILIVTADHGDEFFEHGNKGHHRTLYDEVVRVPLVIVVPGREPRRSIVTTESSIVDIYPTVLSLLGLDVPEGVDGEDLAPLVFGESAERSRSILSELYRPQSLNMQASLRTPELKVTQHFKYRLLEAYDPAADPGETRPIPSDSASVTDLASQLAMRLDRGWRTFRAERDDAGETEVHVDLQTKEGLRALGYLE